MQFYYIFYFLSKIKIVPNCQIISEIFQCSETFNIFMNFKSVFRIVQYFLIGDFYA